MKIHYLEIVTHDVEGVCATYSQQGAQFGAPVPELGNARTAPQQGGGLIGVRAPLRPSELPVVRPYWLVNDIQAAAASIETTGGTIAVPPMELPGLGWFAIYLLGGNDHGLWQV